MKSHLLTNEQQQTIDFSYAKPLKDLTDIIATGNSLTPEQQKQGLELTKQYYTYLSQCAVPYGKIALAIINKQGFVGEMTDLQLERQLKFEGINNIAERKPLLTISLAQRDAELRVVNSYIPSSKITDYHVEIYGKLKLPIYAWSGLFIAKVAGDEVWESALNDNNVFIETVKNSFSIAQNLSQDHIAPYSVARMANSFIDAVKCSATSLTAVCPPNFGVIEFSLDSDPHTALAKKWDVDKSQVIKADPNASLLKYMNKDIYFFKDHEYYIVSKPTVLLEEPLNVIKGEEGVDNFNTLSHFKEMVKVIKAIKYAEIFSKLADKINKILKKFAETKEEEIQKDISNTKTKIDDENNQLLQTMQAQLNAKKVELEKEANAFADKVLAERMAQAKANAHITHPNGGSITISAEDVRAEKIAQATQVYSTIAAQMQSDFDRACLATANKYINPTDQKRQVILNTITDTKASCEKFKEQLLEKMQTIIGDDNNLNDFSLIEEEAQNYANNVQKLLGVHEFIE
jgi:hypothetical protein